MNTSPGPSSDDDSVFRRVLEAGADIAGGASGVAAGLVLAGPPGAFAGAAAGPAVASVMKDVIRRALSRREETRIGGAFLAASAAYEEHRRDGGTLRDDGFFDASAGRSSAEEVFEGVLQAARVEHQERKIPFMGYLMANIAFDDTLDVGLVNWAIVTAESLTWTQFVLLSAVGRNDHFRLPDADYGHHAASWNTWSVHNQLADLGVTKREMVGAPPGKTERMALSIFNYNMSELVLREPGLLLFHLLWLDRVPDDDVLGIITSLSDAPPAESP